MYHLGGDERNGGNISYMLDKKEVAEYLNLDSIIRTIPTHSHPTNTLAMNYAHEPDEKKLTHTLAKLWTKPSALITEKIF